MRALSAISLLLLLSCGGTSKPTSLQDGRIKRGDAKAAETAKLNLFLDEVFQRNLKRNPQGQTRLGIKVDYDKWTSLSDAFLQETEALKQEDLRRLHSEFDFEGLSPQGQLSYRLFEYETKLDLEGFKWRFHTYPINQMYGIHSSTPAFLINFHRVDNKDDAEAYISRLRGIEQRFAELRKGVHQRKEMGILPPKFVLEMALADSKKIIEGKPFSGSEPNALLADFVSKLGKLEKLDGKTRNTLTKQAEAALLEQVGPAYRALIKDLEQLIQVATDDDGVWKFPKGDEFYAYRLRLITTTGMGADEIHSLGLKEVARIHEEMKAIQAKVGFKGDLRKFFRFMRSDKQFYYPNTDAGRAAYLARVNEVVDDMRGRLDQLFITKPKASLKVKRVEEFREKSAGKAFYSSPAPNGSRPGTYYANLYRMADMPKYQLEALAYHEAIPGHHMQNSIAQELKSLPRFRRFGGYTAYGEGWGLYSEYIPKEMGLYKDPYSDFGRLAMELWRACRLVVDTGLHVKKWTRKQATDYLIENTPNPEGDAVRAIDRYIVMPGQATAYKIGMNKILELRGKAEAKLGTKFDVREFHDVVLTSGPVPLLILEELVDKWIGETLAK